MQTLRVLIVDSDEGAGLALGREVMELGHIVIVATSDEEAMSFGEVMTCDTIITHGALSSLAIERVLHWSNSKAPALPVIVLNDNTPPHDPLPLLQQGALDVLHLPPDALWLALVLERAAAALELRRLRLGRSAAPALALHQFAHAVNNPLASIGGLVQLWMDDPTLPTLLRDDLHLIADNVLRLSRMVNEMAQREQV